MHLLIFEPRTQGHHLTWLRYVTEDFLRAGFRLTLAVDYRQHQQKLIHDTLHGLLGQLELVSALDKQGSFWVRKDAVLTLSELFRQSQADDIFFTNFDEVASRCLRRLAVGMRPPANLHGHLNGIYFRPRVLAQNFLQKAFSLKASGFRKAIQQGWIQRLWLLDEYLLQQAQAYAENTFYHLPDPWHGDFSINKHTARAALQVPQDSRIVLSYGLMTPRKGLHVLAQSLWEMEDKRLFLLCAGRIRDEAARPYVRNLVALGRAHILDHYVSESEEALCFAAADIVVLPYLHHFGSSGVLSRAAAAGKLVIGSESGLLGQRIRQHQLGWTFADGEHTLLMQLLDKTAQLSSEQFKQFQTNGLTYAQQCSRGAYREALLSAFN